MTSAVCNFRVAQITSLTVIDFIKEKKRRFPFENKIFKNLYLETTFQICPRLRSVPIKDSKLHQLFQTPKPGKRHPRPPSLN